MRSSPALSGCALLLLLLGLVALLTPRLVEDALADQVRSWQGGVEARLPADLPEMERTRLAWAFEDAIYAVQAGNHDPAVLAEVRRQVEDGSGRLTREQVERLRVDLWRLAGQRPATEPAAVVRPD